MTEYLKTGLIILDVIGIIYLIALFTVEYIVRLRGEEYRENLCGMFLLPKRFGIQMIIMTIVMVMIFVTFCLFDSGVFSW
jgi:hypothetical protein